MSERLEGRLHPVTPLRKSWAVLFALGTLVYQQADLFTTDPPKPGDEAVTVPLYSVVITGALIVGLVIALFVAAWRVSFYRLDGSVLEYRSGLLFKNQRRFELDHVQTVDIQRPLFGRLVGVCTLNVRLVGQTMSLSYVTLNQARALKARILCEDTGDTVVYRVRTRDLVLSLLLDVRTNLIALIMGVAGVLPYILSGELLSLGTLLAFAPRVWGLTGKRLFVWHAWTVTHAADGAYRIGYGMFDTGQYTYRSDRVASVALHQPVLWRRFGWVKVTVAIAGAGKPGVLLPVASRATAEKMVAHLLGDAVLDAVTDPIPAASRASRCTLFHKAHGYRTTGGFFAAWTGIFLHNVITVCPVARIQMVNAIDGPWMRFNGLAFVEVNMAGGEPVTAKYRDRYEASILRAVLTRASQTEARTQLTTPA